MNAKLLGGFLLCIGGCGAVEHATACLPVTARTANAPAAMFLDAAAENSHHNTGLVDTGLIHDSPSPDEVSHAAGVVGGGRFDGGRLDLD